MVAPVAAARRPWPETWSAWLWVLSTCLIRTLMYRTSVRYSSISNFGSTTAATPASSSPIGYDAQPRSSWMSCRKITVHLVVVVGRAAARLASMRSRLL